MRYMFMALTAAVLLLTGCKTNSSNSGYGPNDRSAQSSSDNLRPGSEIFSPRAK